MIVSNLSQRDSRIASPHTYVISNSLRYYLSQRLFRTHLSIVLRFHPTLPHPSVRSSVSYCSAANPMTLFVQLH
jgi:hypothetical protein